MREPRGEGGSFTEDPGGCVKEGSRWASLSMGAPLGNLEGGLYARDFERE